MTGLLMELSAIALIVGLYKQTALGLLLTKLPVGWVAMFGS